MKTMKKLVSYLMALTVVLAFASCSSKNDEPKPRSLTSVEYVTLKKMFTSQASGIVANGGPVAGQLSTDQDATLSFSSNKDFAFSNQISLTALRVPFKIKVSFSGTYTAAADGSLSLQAKGETLKIETEANLPPEMAAQSDIIKWGIQASLGLTKEKLNKSAIPCKVDQAGHKLTLTYPEDWKTPMTNVFVWTATAQ